jgi:hypothetical protein
MALHILVLCLADKLRAPASVSLVIISTTACNLMKWFNIQMGVQFPKTHPVARWLGHNNELYARGAICHPSNCQFVRHTIFFGQPNFHILELLRGPPSKWKQDEGWTDWPQHTRFWPVWGKYSVGCFLTYPVQSTWGLQLMSALTLFQPFQRWETLDKGWGFGSVWFGDPHHWVFRAVAL